MSCCVCSPTEQVFVSSFSYIIFKCMVIILNAFLRAESTVETYYSIRPFCERSVNCCLSSPTLCLPLASTALTQTVISILLKKQLLSTAPKLSQESWRTAALIQTKQVRPPLNKHSAGREGSLAREAQKRLQYHLGRQKYVISNCSLKKCCFYVCKWWRSILISHASIVSHNSLFIN